MWLRIVLSLIRRPVLWPTALRQARRLAPTRWWEKRPFLPVPPDDYLRFRAVTQHGGNPLDGTAGTMTADDVVDYLRWCREARR